jgi:ABC-type Na+ efflux pump permease subunit
VTILVLQDQGGLLEAYKKQLQDSNAPAETVKQITEIMQSPEVFGAMMILMLAMVFVAFTLPMILGGAAAAKALGRE